MKVVRRPEYRFLTLTLVGNNLTRRGGPDIGGPGSPSFVTQLNLTVVELLDLSQGGGGGGGPGGSEVDEALSDDEMEASRRALYDPEGAALYICAVVLVYGLSMVLLIASFAKTGNGERSATSGYDESQTHKYLREISSLKERSEREIYRQLKRNIIIRVKQSPSSRDRPPTPPLAVASASSAADCSLLQPHHPSKDRRSSWIQIDAPLSPNTPDAVFDDDGDSRTTCSPDLTLPPSATDLDLSLLTAGSYHQRTRSIDRGSPGAPSPSSSVQTSPEVFLTNADETSTSLWSNSVRLSPGFASNSVQTSVELHRSNSVRFSPEIGSKSVQKLRATNKGDVKSGIHVYAGEKLGPVRCSAFRSDAFRSSADRKGPIGRNVKPVGALVRIVRSHSVQRILSAAMTTQGTRNKNACRFEPVTSTRRVRLRSGGGGGGGGGNVGREGGRAATGGKEREERDKGAEIGGIEEGRDVGRGVVGRDGRGRVTLGGIDVGRGRGERDARGVIDGVGGGIVGGREVGERGIVGEIVGGIVGGRRAKVRPQSLTALAMRPWFADHGKSFSEPVSDSAVRFPGGGDDGAETGVRDEAAASKHPGIDGDCGFSRQSKMALR